GGTMLLTVLRALCGRTVKLMVFPLISLGNHPFFFSSRRRHTRSVSAFLLNRSSDLLPPETELSRQMTTSTTSIDIMGLQAAYANLHTDQERDYFMQRYHDVISSFGGKTSYDADNRPLLVMRSNLWA